MTIEIKNPSPELEKEILTFIPVTHRYYEDGSFYIDSEYVAIDPFTDFVNIAVHRRYITIKLHFYMKLDCETVIAHKGGL